MVTTVPTGHVTAAVPPPPVSSSNFVACSTYICTRSGAGSWVVGRFCGASGQWRGGGRPTGSEWIIINMSCHVMLSQIESEQQNAGKYVWDVDIG